jgi:hypothetical protein
MRNENGSVMLVTIIVLVLLSIIGISSMNMSITEQKITTNMLLHQISFYAAESGIAVGPLWYAKYHKDNDIDVMTIPLEDALVWEDGNIENLSKGVTYDYTVSYRNDGTDIFIEPVSLMPDIVVYSKGIHSRNSLSEVEATFSFSPAMSIPTNPIWAEDYVEITGSATVDSEFRLCDGESTPAEVKFQEIDYFYAKEGACLDGNCDNVIDVNPFDMSIIDELIDGMPTYTDLPSDAGTYVHDNDWTNDYPKVIHITNDVHINNSDTFVGSGILVIDGDLIVNGGFEWYGVVIVKGMLDAKGTAYIQGSLVAGDSEGMDVDLTGNFNIAYDCELIDFVYNSFSKYEMTSWKQI